jgi:hypothetical protein
MTKEELSELRLTKNEPCISIIVPTTKVSPKGEQDTAEIDGAIKRAMDILVGKYGEEKGVYLLNKLRRVSAAIDSVTETEGIGIFLSKDISKVVRFPFPVIEKVFVGDEFETRDLLYSTKSLFNYYFLLINNRVTRLFKGYGDLISEVIDENYPKAYDNDEVYEKSHTTGPVSYALRSEIEKINIEERRVRTLLQNVDYLLFLYLKKDTPLFVGGLPEFLAYYRHVTNYSRNIVGLVEGNFERCSVDDIKGILRNELKKFADREGDIIIRGFQDMIGSGRVVLGIANVWKAAAEGKVMNLLVEKDFIYEAYVSQDRKKIFADGSAPSPNLAFLDDAVNDLLEVVIDKGGDVIFVENGKLAKYDRIAAVLKHV